MSSQIVTPGQARAEALGIEAPTDAQFLARGMALGRIQGSLDAASLSVALVAAVLIGHGLKVDAFGPPRPIDEDSTEAHKRKIERFNAEDEEYAQRTGRRIQGALALAGQLVAAGHAIAADMLGMVPSEPALAAEEPAE